MSQHIKTHDGYDVKVPTQGQVDLNTVLGALGTASFAGLDLRSLISRLGGGAIDTATLMTMLAMQQQGQRGGCSEDHYVNRYELGMEQELAKKDSEIALLKANTYQDQKALELYRYIDGKLNEINARLASQDVRNQGFVDAFRELSKDLDNRINLEAERRKCADDKIVCYANGTFATKLISNYEAGTTTTAMETMNPLCGCC